MCNVTCMGDYNTFNWGRGLDAKQQRGRGSKWEVPGGRAVGGSGKGGRGGGGGGGGGEK